MIDAKRITKYLYCFGIFNPSKQLIAPKADNFYLFVLTPLEGGGTIYSNGLFCSDNFGRSIYSS